MNSNWSYSPETKIWVVTSVTLTFDLWPWPFAWTLPWSNVITPENFMMIRWWEHSQKGVTDGQTDRRTDGRTDRRTENTIHRAAWLQLKMPLAYYILHNGKLSHGSMLPYFYRKKIQWHFHQNKKKINCQIAEIEKVACKITMIWSQPQCLSKWKILQKTYDKD